MGQHDDAVEMMRRTLAAAPAFAVEQRAVVVPEEALRDFVDAVAELLHAFGAEHPTSGSSVLRDVHDTVTVLRHGTVRLLPQHVYELAQSCPPSAIPHELWVPLVESGLRLQEERDSLAEACGALEAELAHVDELIRNAHLDPAVTAAHRELVARVHRPPALGLVESGGEPS